MRKTPRINKIKLDLDSGLDRPTAYTDCPPTRLRAVRIRRKTQQKTNTNLSHNRANFRIENQKRKRKARSSMRIPKVR